ncbi:unnamed protein product [Angiostrongylus costaricensis]|uniref:MSP domain-containing protein n=1 Tax=Angiostrongylus costaricensis TaxID=334426 RepID=A0A0R3PC47_ANGCS|nr:unnamed protein product [Angiostrongylus costaricensis]
MSARLSKVDLRRDVDYLKSVVSFAVFAPEHNGEDLITNPMCTQLIYSEFQLEFPRFGRRRCKKITMSNVSQRKILWKLRSNIAHFLLATPTAGILEAGQHDYVKVTMNDNCIENGKVL